MTEHDWLTFVFFIRVARNDCSSGKIFEITLASFSMGHIHTSTGSRGVFPVVEAVEWLLTLYPTGRVQCWWRVDRISWTLGGFIKQRDNLRSLDSMLASVKADDLSVSRYYREKIPAFRRADMWSGESDPSHRRTQSRSLRSFAHASTSSLRAQVWYCAKMSVCQAEKTCS